MAARLCGVWRDVKLCQRFPDEFYWRPSSTGAPWKMLYLRLPRWPYYTIKVDLLSDEADIGIPDGFYRKRFVYVNKLPVAPLYLVLFHKLLGWHKCVRSAKSSDNEKARDIDQYDVIDICELNRQYGPFPLSKSHVGRSYLERFRDLADEFCAELGTNYVVKRFKKMGLDV
ncbi:hypothetical protein PIIN_07029 [Serendipita indica DSM 11827]|uniref:Uncharacterized protein n=1 Tax=Serendipita indica (strain DSM 11827) TaxID=1109443 RepID=G4TP27_SERID|nr:hypothetical protein PIIN_07029 [Serendipita indica DSM 11827]